jgi:cytochrome c5
MLLLVAGLNGAPGSAAAEKEKSAAEALEAALKVAPIAFETDIAPLLQKYCNDCHSGEKPRAGLVLDKYENEKGVIENRKTWEKVLKMVRTREMPPPKRSQFAPEELERFTGWVDAAINRIDCSQGVDPGRVTIRRLNRVEYNTTIRDLVGVNFQPAEDFPSDDVGYGFDNIGDVLSLPPLLLEKYLAAAEKITQAAILTGSALEGPVAKFNGNQLAGPGGGSGTARGLASNGELSTEFDFSKAGEYVLRARAYGQQAGSEVVKMAFRLDGKEAKVVEVAAVEGEPGIYELRQELPAGKRKVGVAFLNDYYNPKDPDPGNRDRNLVVESLEIQGPLDPSGESLPEMHRRIVFCRPEGEARTAESCAREILARFATRAYRRPATDEELQRLVGLALDVMKDGGGFEDAIQTAVQAVLVSPHFLFRIELDQEPNNPAAVHRINAYELATRLSYFLWSSLPDQELFEQARNGKLLELPTLDAQVRRMLQDPKSQALVENFGGQWLQTRSLKTFAPDPAMFPSFDEALRTAMRRETELFFGAVMREDRSLLDFVDGNFTFVNERLARHYGIPDIKGDEFQRVALPEQRGGILSQASVLAITSNPTRTSPVKRGKWVLENLLGAPPPPPPPNVPELNEAKDVVLTGTLRQRMEQHRANPACASCHQRMDPLGFGLENFDAIGAWRTQDGKFDIDPSGTLPSGESFSGPRELRAVLKAHRDEFRHCLAEKMLTYALGRGLEYYDKCAVDRITAAVAREDDKFSSLILEIVHSDPFQKRRGKRGEP